MDDIEAALYGGPMASSPEKHILVIEDSPAVIELLRTALATLPDPETRTLHPFLDGAQGLAAARQAPPYTDLPRPSLIILDLNMPVMGGLQFLEERQRDPRLRTIPVVVLSTSKKPAQVERAYLAGANAYVTKPDTFECMCTLIGCLDRFWLHACDPVP